MYRLLLFVLLSVANALVYQRQIPEAKHIVSIKTYDGDNCLSENLIHKGYVTFLPNSTTATGEFSKCYNVDSTGSVQGSFDDPTSNSDCSVLLWGGSDCTQLMSTPVNGILPSNKQCISQEFSSLSVSCSVGLKRGARPAVNFAGEPIGHLPENGGVWHFGGKNGTSAFWTRFAKGSKFGGE